MDDRPGPRLVWWRLLGWLITLLALGFVVRWLLKVDHAAWRTLLELNGWWLAASVAVFQVWFILRFWGWEFIIRRHGYTAQRQQNLRMWISSELLRYIPGNIWSFAGRFQGATAGGVERKSSIHALILEAAGLLSAAGIVSLASLGQPWIWWTPLAVILVVVVMPIIIRWMMRIMKHEALQFRWTEMAALLGLYLAVWIVFGLAHIVLFHALRPTIGALPASVAMGVSVFSWFIGYITIITPMGLGVREATFSKSLVAATSLSVSTAGLVAVISRVWLVVSEVIFFTLVMGWSSLRTRRS